MTTAHSDDGDVLHHRIGDLEIMLTTWCFDRELHHRIGDLENYLSMTENIIILHHRIGDLETC